MTTIITVDGPSGVGKGTLCYALAQKLGFQLLDSGAIYRVCALASLNAHADIHNETEIAYIAKQLPLQFCLENGEVNVLLDGENVNQAIRTEKVAKIASQIAMFPAVREALLHCQQNFAKGKGLIADGRDMGTVVFPNAQIKFFLDASAEERAKRRVRQLQNRGINGNFGEVLSEIQARDLRDRNRSIAPLKPAEDAYLIDSTHLSIDEVIEKAMDFIAKKQNIG